MASEEARHRTARSLQQIWLHFLFGFVVVRSIPHVCCWQGTRCWRFLTLTRVPTKINTIFSLPDFMNYFWTFKTNTNQKTICFIVCAMAKYSDVNIYLDYYQFYFHFGWKSVILFANCFYTKILPFLAQLKRARPMAWNLNIIDTSSWCFCCIFNEWNAATNPK